MQRRTALLAVIAAAAIGALPAFAQSWPAQPVKVIVPYSPGTGMDILARALQPKLSEMWKQPVVVENRPGASGNIGAAAVAKATDGHTLVTGVNTLMINRALYTNMQYDPLTDLAPIGLAATGSFLLVAHPKLGIKDVKELIARAKEKPGSINYGSPGIATPHHMAMELFKLRAAIDVSHVPFSATGPALQQLLSGEVPLMFLPVHVAMPHVRGGKLVALAAGSAKRLAQAPDVPTLSEQGLPEAEADLWYGLMAPAGTPRPVVDRINADMQKALAMPDVRNSLVAQGLEVHTSTPDQLGEMMKRDAARWAQVVKTAGIKPE